MKTIYRLGASTTVQRDKHHVARCKLPEHGGEKNTVIEGRGRALDTDPQIVSMRHDIASLQTHGDP